MQQSPLHIRVHVTTPPYPGLLRLAIERRMRRQVFPGAAEDLVAKAVADAIQASDDSEAILWR
jgi:hypothetical protein